MVAGAANRRSDSWRRRCPVHVRERDHAVRAGARESFDGIPPLRRGGARRGKSHTRCCPARMGRHGCLGKASRMRDGDSSPENKPVVFPPAPACRVDQQPLDRAIVEGLHVDDALGCFDQHHDGATFQRIARSDAPFDDGALGHVGAQGRHAELDAHARRPSSCRTALMMRAGLGQGGILQVFGIWDRHLDVHTRATGASRS